MKKILLCPPTYYDIEYEINPWMHIDNKVNREEAEKNYRQIKKLYQSLGVDIFEIEPIPGLPDMVYTANFGQVAGSLFIRSNFRFEERRKEADFASIFFEQNFNMETVSLPRDIFFEGQGDLLTDGNRFFFGWGKRSDRRAKLYLEKHLGREIIDFELVNPYFYHLDTALAPLSPEIAVYNPESFTEEGVRKIYRTFKKCISTNEVDNKVIACNMVIIEKNIVHGAGISERLSNDLVGLGYKLHPVDTVEYIKGGGSVKCVSFEF